MHKIALASWFFLIIGRLAVQGAVQIVGDPNPDYVTITNALHNAGENDVIRCSTGLYLEVFNVYNHLNVTIDGNYDAGCVSKVAGGGTYLRLPPPGLGASILRVSNATVRLVDLDIANAAPWGSFELNGGGIHIAWGSKVTLDGCSVYNNQAIGYGGGIYVEASTLILTNSLVASNSVSTGGGSFAGCGGGIAAIDSVVDIRGGGAGSPTTCRVDYNLAHDKGGGIYLERSRGSITGETADIRYNVATNGGGIAAVDSSFLDIGGGADLGGNHAHAAGGGILLAGYATGVVHGSQTHIGFNATSLGPNTASNILRTSVGGGISVQYAVLLVENNACVAHNMAARAGGGIYISNGYCRIDHASVGYPYNTVHTNWANSGGGIQATYGSELELVNGALVKGNVADYFYGGGIYGYRSTLTMEDSAVEDNVAEGDHGGGIYLSSGTITGRQINVYGNKCYGDDGGGMYAYRSAGRLDEVTFTNNWVAGNGGAIAWEGLAADVLDITGSSLFRRNSAGNHGGGFWLQGPVNFYDGSIRINGATNHGGGMYLTGAYARVYLENVGMEFNYADDDGDHVGNGGAICMEGAGASLVARSPGGLTFIGNNSAYNGGAIYMGAGTTTRLEQVLSMLYVDNNEAANDGGGLAVYGGDLVVSGDVRIVRNEAARDGGGLYLFEARAHLFDGVEVGRSDTNQLNYAVNYGGGLAANSSTVLLHNVSFLHNKAGDYSGGMELYGSVISGTNVLVLGNRVLANDGGGIFAERTAGVFAHCSFVSNFAVEGRGGGAFWNNHSLTLMDCAFSGNEAQSGAGLYGSGANGILEDVTFSGNLATNAYGGGLYWFAQPLFMKHCTVAGNVAKAGAGMTLANAETLLEAVTVTVNRAAAEGGGILLEMGTKLYGTNLVLIGNVADSDADFTGNGGGIMVQGGSEANLRGTNGTTMINSNSAAFGGGAAVSNGQLVIENRAWMEGNQASRSGAGLQVGNAATGVVIGAYMLRNDATFDGGAAHVLTNGYLYANNTLMAENRVDPMGYGGGVYVQYGVADLSANTIVSNEVGGVECAKPGSAMSMAGCIVRGHSIQNVTPGFTVEYSCIEGGYPGLDNFDEDPRLYNGNYHLTAWSPCIERGWMLMGGHDVDGEARTGRLDVGFDEYVDGDADRLPDIVETDTGVRVSDIDMGTDPTVADSDDDGISDGDEWMADTDPNNPSSLLMITNVSISAGGAFVVDWSGGTNAWQYLEVARDFMHTNNADWDIYSTYPPPTEPSGRSASSFRTTSVFRVRATRFPAP